KLEIRVTEEDRTPRDARISVTDSTGRFWAPEGAWIHADDGFDLKKMPFESHYYHDLRGAFHSTGEIDVPAGEITVEVSSGFEYSPVRRTISLKAGESGELTIALQPLVWRADHAAHWISGDLHAHMNYGGEYASFPWRLVSEAEAEG